MLDLADRVFEPAEQGRVQWLAIDTARSALGAIARGEALTKTSAEFDRYCDAVNDYIADNVDPTDDREHG
jgi:hypothetical protein